MKKKLIGFLLIIGVVCSLKGCVSTTSSNSEQGVDMNRTRESNEFYNSGQFDLISYECIDDYVEIYIVKYKVDGTKYMMTTKNRANSGISLLKLDN